MEAVLKKIRIQTGVVKRIHKEEGMYKEEALQIEEQIRKMKAGNEDEYVIRKREEVLEESRMMVPDCERRLRSGVEVLAALLDDNQELCKGEELFVAARKVLEEVGKSE